MGDKYRHSVTSCYLSSRRGFLGSPRGELSTQLTEGGKTIILRATIGRSNK